MPEIILNAQVRKKEEKGSLNSLRGKGLIPVVCYGAKIKSLPLVVEYLSFQKVFAEAGENTVISLDFDNKKNKVLVKDVQYHPVTGRFMHVDFLAVDITKEITAMVPLDFIGVSKAVKDDGGVLVKNIDEIEVECLPTSLPKEINVHIESLKTFDDVIKVGDLAIPEQVKISLNKDDIVATVTPPRSEEELEKLNEEVKEEVESVEGVKKEEPELEATETEAGAKPEKKEEKKETEDKSPKK